MPERADHSAQKANDVRVVEEAEEVASEIVDGGCKDEDESSITEGARDIFIRLEKCFVDKMVFSIANVPAMPSRSYIETRISRRKSGLLTCDRGHGPSSGAYRRETPSDGKALRLRR